jgi:hypothetical protein
VHGSRLRSIIQRALALAAAVLGLATIAAGVRVLAGADPGYVVFRPLLRFNTAMGFAYVAAGALAWRDVTRGRSAAAVIFALNLCVLGVIGYLYATGSAVAVESVRAMALRSAVWLALVIGLASLQPGGVR